MAFIIVLAITYISLVLHEFGHYSSNKIFNLKVRECCVGTGPVVLKFNFKETKMYFRIVPIGGYVGTDEEELDKLNLFQYWIVIISGVFMNFMVCIISLYIESSSGLLYSLRLAVALLVDLLFNIESNLNLLSMYFVERSTRSFITSLNSGLVSINIWEIVFIVNATLLMVNLIPLPVLDGGQIITVTLKKILLSLKKSNITISKTI